jgi:hypothetical protein
LPTVRSNVLISASPEAVWDVLVDPVYSPKLHRDVLFMEVDPQGKAVKGQRRRAIARAGRTKIEIVSIVTEAVRPQRFVLEQVPGALFTSYKEEIRLTASAVGTEVRANFEYAVSREYVRDALNIAALENGVGESLGVFLKNLKEIAELKPLEPGTK